MSSTPPSPRQARRRVRVASVPGSHVYVRHLSDARELGVDRLPDPRPSGSAGPGSPWWPPRMLEAAWVEEQHESFDVMHVHFGFDACSPADLAALVAALRRHRKPLVLTVHDLRNPHHTTSDEHDAQLDVLVPAAAAIVTLTPGAAAQIRRRWGREAHVVPHPHVVELGRMDRPSLRGRDGLRRIGVHAKSLRSSMDPGAVLPVLAEVAAERPGTVLQVNVHRDVAERTGARHDAGLMKIVDSLGPDVEVAVHDFLPDDALWDYLSSLDVSVLPYRFGTHSGWLEACRDLGTAVVVPTCGFYAEQGEVESYAMDEHRFDAASLRRAVERALVDPPARVSPAFRRAQRAAVADRHRAIYDAVLAS